MKHLKIILMSLVGGLMFTGCPLSEEATEVEHVDIKNESELYGAWKQMDLRLCGLGPVCDHYTYSFGKDSSFFVDTDVAPDSSKASFMVLPISMHISDGNRLTVYPNALTFNRHIRSAEPYVTPYSQSVKGIDSSYVYTVSNLDSIVEAIRLRDVGRVPSDGEYLQVPDSLSLVIIQYGELNGKKRIHTVLESCYQDHAEAQNLKDLCDVNIFEKDDNLDLKGILSQVDTVSSTEICEDIRDRGVNVYLE